MMNRRNFLHQLGVAAAACALPVTTAYSLPRAAGKRQPNIVFIYADDHAINAVSSYGSKINKTPNIDRLASEGVRFSRSYVSNSICGPARATILTGTHSHVNGQTDNRAKFDDTLPTYAKIMQQSGYQTAMIGKWHIKSNPNGFDHWEKSSGYYNPTFVSPEGTKRVKGYTTEVITEKGLDWIGKRDEEKPFMLWLCHNASHRTWMPGTQYLDHYDDKTIPEPDTLLDDYAGRSPGAEKTQMRISRDLFPAYDLKLPVTGEGILDNGAKNMLSGMSPEQRSAWDVAYEKKNKAFAEAKLSGDDLTRWNYQRYIKDYLRCVDALDDSVGRVMAFLKENNLEEDTILIYSSDQGFFLGEHGWYDKRWIYEPAFNTPLVVRWPGVAKAGTVCEELVQNIDMAPTFLDMANMNVPGTMQGESLVPLLKGKTPDDWRDAVYYHYFQRDTGRTTHTVAPHYGVRTKRYKLLHVYDFDTWEFYDLKKDPDEMRNLYNAPKYAGVIGKLKEKLKENRAVYGDPV